MSAELAIPNLEMTESIKPTHAAVTRVVANIRTWRTYLPAACVTAMIKDEWQWST
jgi:hypothetical protein